VTLSSRKSFSGAERRFKRGTLRTGPPAVRWERTLGVNAVAPYHDRQSWWGRETWALVCNDVPCRHRTLNMADERSDGFIPSSGFTKHSGKRFMVSG